MKLSRTSLHTTLQPLPPEALEWLANTERLMNAELERQARQLMAFGSVVIAAGPSVPAGEDGKGLRRPEDQPGPLRTHVMRLIIRPAS